MQGGPVTVTHAEANRYFMTIPEASKLILQAGALGQGGEVFILEMGTPVNIHQMAIDLIRLSGKEPDSDIKIVFTGLRPGEKLSEKLVVPGEMAQTTAHEKILVISEPTEGHYSEDSNRKLMQARHRRIVHPGPGNGLRSHQKEDEGYRAGVYT
jgi:FlaA1/EpsC-like NDP-sugar epimerase